MAYCAKQGVANRPVALRELFRRDPITYTD